MSTSYSIVVTTYSKEETGSRIIDALLSAKLAACVQVVPIRSFYTWKGKVLKDRERQGPGISGRSGRRSSGIMTTSCPR
jgi:uncharacterized protein involved in tolerance to divalent cations